MGFCVRHIEEQTIIDIQASRLRSHLIYELKELIEKLIKANRLKISINMSNVVFFDHILFGIFIKTQQKCIKRGGNFNIFEVKNELLMLMYIVKLDKYLDIYMNELDALKKHNVIVKRRLRAVS